MIPWAIGAVALIYLLVIRNSGAGNNVVGALTNAVGKTVEFFERFIIGTVIFIVAFMILNRITGVPPEYATEGFRVLGVRPWGWPAHVGLPLLVFAVTTLYACHLAINFAHGKTRMVGILFGGVLIAFLLPETVGKAVPSNIDHATAQDGVAGVGATAAVAVVGGQRAFDEDKGVWGSTTERFNRFWFGKPRPTPPPQIHNAPAPAPTRVVKVGKEKQTYRFSENGCATVVIHSSYELYPKGGEIVISPPSGDPWHSKPGVQNPHRVTPTGMYTMCRVESDAWGVEIWQ